MGRERRCPVKKPVCVLYIWVVCSYLSVRPSGLRDPDRQAPWWPACQTDRSITKDACLFARPGGTHALGGWPCRVASCSVFPSFIPLCSFSHRFARSGVISRKLEPGRFWGSVCSSLRG